MDHDVAQRPGKSDILGLRREGVVGLQIVRHESYVLILGVLDQCQLSSAHLLGQFRQVLPREPFREILKALFATSHRFEVDHNLLESRRPSTDSLLYRILMY